MWHDRGLTASRVGGGPRKQQRSKVVGGEKLLELLAKIGWEMGVFLTSSTKVLKDSNSIHGEKSIPKIVNSVHKIRNQEQSVQNLVTFCLPH